ncbi:FimD/PapC N-terminal domain-containing protein, partial [Enterobacter hormaechei]
FIALVCAASWAEADEAIEFNTDVLDASDRHNVDLQRFSEGNFVAPGEYLLDVRINSQEIPQQTIRYIADPANSHKSMACL